MQAITAVMCSLSVLQYRLSLPDISVSELNATLHHSSLYTCAVATLFLHDRAYTDLLLLQMVIHACTTYMYALLHTGDNCTVSFLAHRVLLCRYSYFSALLSGNFSEARHSDGESTTVSTTEFTTSNHKAIATVDLSGFVQDGLSDPRLFGVLLRQVYQLKFAVACHSSLL
jgi:hypothetical protein